MRKYALLFIILLALAVFPALTSASGSVEIKKGEWIQYQVIVTGNPGPDYNITWANMNVTDVEGEKITVNVLTEFANGTVWSEPGIKLDLATGAIGDGFFVPTNLTVGDVYCSQYEGNITITSVGQLAIGDDQRTVLCGVANMTSYKWDQQTGIMLAATSNYPTYTMQTTTSSTNIWHSQTYGYDQTLFYAAVVALAVVVVFVVVHRFRLHRSR